MESEIRLFCTHKGLNFREEDRKHIKLNFWPFSQRGSKVGPTTSIPWSGFTRRYICK